MTQKTFDYFHSQRIRLLSSHLSGLVEGRLWLKVLLGMFFGLLVGALLGPTAGLLEPEMGATIGNWLAFPGLLFIAVIQMIVIPLVIASIVRGLAASQSLDQLKKLGLRVTLFFTVTTALAATIGLWIGSVINPGKMMKGLKPSISNDLVENASAMPSVSEIPEIMLGLLPGNPLEAMVSGQMLQVVIFSVIIGISLVSMETVRAKPMLELLDSVQQICMTIVGWAMKLAPIAVFGLTAQLATKIGFSALLGMAVYVATVLCGLFLMFVTYLILLRVFTDSVKSFEFIRASKDVLLLAFSTSSSAAVMPLSIKTAEEKLGVRASVAQFVIPLGATINMNGTALYQSVATVFLAQVYGVDLSIGSMALIVAMAVGASIGSPATPGVGIVILSMVLGTVGIPPGGIALIMGVDRILDMSRTAINVAGDLVTCQIMEKWTAEKV